MATPVGASGSPQTFSEKEMTSMDRILAPDASLSEVDDSILIVIDVQQAFLDKLDRQQIAPLVNRIAWIT